MSGARFELGRVIRRRPLKLGPWEGLSRGILGGRPLLASARAPKMPLASPGRDGGGASTSSSSSAFARPASARERLSAPLPALSASNPLHRVTCGLTALHTVMRARSTGATATRARPRAPSGAASPRGYPPLLFIAQINYSSTAPRLAAPPSRFPPVLRSLPP